MRVFIAGATGAMGRPLVRQLIEAGHEAVGLTRNEKGASLLRAIGAIPVVGNALDAPALERIIAEAKPTHVVHLLTAIPPGGARSARDMEPTNEVRIRGTANLIRAAVAAGAKRIVAESFPSVYGIGDVSSVPLDEQAPLLPTGRWKSAPVIDALRSLESQMTEARGIEAVVLRFGLLYGPDVPSTEEMLRMIRARKLPLLRGSDGLASFIHAEDAARATILALTAPKVSKIYNIVDDEPASFNDFVRFAATHMGAPQPFSMPVWVLKLAAPLIAEVATSKLPLSNQRARAELGFVPRYRSFRAGLQLQPAAA